MRLLSLVAFVFGVYATYAGGMALWHSLRLDANDTHYLYSVRLFGLTMTLQTARIVQGVVFIAGLAALTFAVFVLFRSRAGRA